MQSFMNLVIIWISRLHRIGRVHLEFALAFNRPAPAWRSQSMTPIFVLLVTACGKLSNNAVEPAELRVTGVAAAVAAAVVSRAAAAALVKE